MSANLDTRTNPATTGKRITFADGTDVILPNNKFPRGFIPEASGTVSVILAEDEANAAPQTIVVTQGLVYPISCRRFRSTGAVTVTAVFVYG